MSLDVDGFDEPVTGGCVAIAISNDHHLMKLAQKLPWEEMLKLGVSPEDGTKLNIKMHFPG